MNGDIEEGHLSSALCHMGLDSHKLGKAASREEIQAAVSGHAHGNSGFERICAHLDANGVDAATHPAILGRPLELDPKTELYLDDDQANALARGTYAPGFEVPEDV